MVDSEPPARNGTPRSWAAFAILAASTAASIAGVEMVLPVVPDLPSALTGTSEQAQLVIASYFGGGALGMVAFGELSARFDGRRLLALSLLSYAVLAFVAAGSTDLAWLILVRFVQGAVGTAAIVFAPGMVRTMFPGPAGVRAMGLLGGVGAVAALLSPVLGRALGDVLGWRAALAAPGLVALTAGLAVAIFGRALPRSPPARLGGFGLLLRRPAFLCLALNQALAQTAILTFAFGAPALLAGGHLFGTSFFVVLRVLGIATYVITAAVGWRVSWRLGIRRTIVMATILSAGAAALSASIALAAGMVYPSLIACWLFVNVGQGLREPATQIRLIEASEGDPARAISATSLIALLMTSVLTVVTAPLVISGAAALTACAALIWALAVAAITVGLLFLPA